MFLDEVQPHELGFSAEEWETISLFDRRIAVAFFARRTPIGTARALGMKYSGFSTVRRKIAALNLVHRFALVKQVHAPGQPCGAEK